jgi:hypothetical protein
MAQVITIAGERLFALKAQNNEQLDIDTFIFANVPGQDPNATIDRNEGLPPVGQRVHQQIVQQVGRINDNVVVYSTVLDSVTGPFDFNWVGLYSSANQTLIAVSHIPNVSKTITVPGTAGNTLSRNFGIEYSGVADLAGITVDPGTWQLDFTARLSGMDELNRQLAADMNGKNWFIGDGLKVVSRSTTNTFQVTPGAGYVSGLRVELKQDHILTLQSYPKFVYVDAWFDGDASSKWAPKTAFTVTNGEMNDYIDVNGKSHYVFKLARITAADVVEDLRTIDGLRQEIEKVESRVKETKSITDYGSKKDASADDTSIFNSVDKSEVIVPTGKYIANIDKFDKQIIFQGDALFKDTDTGDFFSICNAVEGVNLKNAFKDVIAMHDSGQAPKIVCYGDSNTRYYEGDTSKAGPYSKSYGAWIDYLSIFQPHLYAAEISINGYPGQTAQYGDANFAANVPDTTDVLVLGFGTNNVKLNTPDVELYLSAMKSMILKAIGQGTTPIVLGIPWFYSTYGSNGAVSQSRVKVWNSRLLSLCQKVGAHFIDTYNLTRKYPFAYFNEASQQRHYNENTTKVIASKIVEKLNVIMASAEKPMTNINKWHDLSFIKSHLGTIKHEVYDNGGHYFEAMLLPAGSSITIPAAGRSCVGFYPRAAATATINTGIQSISHPIEPVIDNGHYYLVDRVATNFSHATKKYDLQITASGGDLYIVGLSFQFGVLIDENIKVATVQLINGANLPAVGLPFRKYWINEISREATFRNGIWYGPEGLYVAGTTLNRNAVQNAPCYTGYKFWNIETQKAERWNGTSWINV